MRAVMRRRSSTAVTLSKAVTSACLLVYCFDRRARARRRRAIAAPTINAASVIDDGEVAALPLAHPPFVSAREASGCGLFPGGATLPSAPVPASSVGGGGEVSEGTQ